MRHAQAASYFRLLGRAVAKALQDCRLLDLPLSPLLYRLALGRPVDLFDMRAVDAQLGGWRRRKPGAGLQGVSRAAAIRVWRATAARPHGGSIAGQLAFACTAPPTPAAAGSSRWRWFCPRQPALLPLLLSLA
jgi:hypothetical protein